MNGKSFFYDILEDLYKFSDYADIYIENTVYDTIVFESGKLDRFEKIKDSGIGLRIIKNYKTYYAYTTSFDIKDIQECVENLCEMSESSEKNDIFSIEKTVSYEYEKSNKTYNLTSKIDKIKNVDSIAWGSKFTKQVSTNFKETKKNIRIITSDGNDLSQELNYVTLFCTVICEKDGVLQTGYESIGGLYSFDKLLEERVEIVSKNALKRALQNLEADYAPAGEMCVILSSNAGGTMVHEAVGHGLEADLATNGLSVYQNKIGEKVASEKITVIDDATLDGKRGSFYFDDEGVEAQRTVLIENGVLKNYMYDRLYAMKNNCQSTGNGRRQSYRYKPIVRMTNTLIAPGNDNPDDIISSVDEGLFVVKMGGGQVNTVNGDFVFEVNEGYLIKNGKIQNPVKNATLIGNGPKIMMEIDMVGNDLGFGIGTCGKDGQGVPVSDAQPTLRIPKITVGGK
ncbi:peptidase U62, modulator of DNA gyrase [Deferribacter desulfuricans SSM1]|uniref:Peptidase U62, modulator of DNA gyrase n=1 Tax=Deferribacter desulfuricans (strain DSM 14783 / JCM 11476 / NBRC 101012 / SSM1) TaxID=639282 RepID=D3PD99_DEFDS|nr:TldD/PmbA family protein [Deferribacter desulfuricans]BAI80572.1 peptidase U62, modulator of DNA gyrase [Deferribacter desulfuricans SSM1]